MHLKGTAIHFKYKYIYSDNASQDAHSKGTLAQAFIIRNYM